MQFVENHRAKPMDILIYIGFCFPILKLLKNHTENRVAFLNSLAKNHVRFTIVKFKCYKFVDNAMQVF